MNKTLLIAIVFTFILVAILLLAKSIMIISMMVKKEGFSMLDNEVDTLNFKF